MDWILHNEVWIVAVMALGLFLLLLPTFFRRSAERRVGRVDSPPKPSEPSNVHRFPARANGAASTPEVAPGPAIDSRSAAEAARQGTGVNTTQGARAPREPEYQENPSAFAIVAEVCSLQPPARERVEQSYKALHVRWKLRLAGISEGIERGPVRSVRMYPDSKSAQSCGIYFVVNLEDYPDLTELSKDEAFVVEGTIENVSGMDIDLKEIHRIEKI
jgi:hypothetical protein